MEEDGSAVWSQFPPARSLSFLPFLVLQCVILHPSIPSKHFEKAQLVLRITPLLIIQSLQSLDGFSPRDEMQLPNFIWTMMLSYGLFKSIEWGFIKDKSVYEWIGFDKPISKNNSAKTHCSWSLPDIGRIVRDQLHLFTSIRGLGYAFGQQHPVVKQERISSLRFFISTSFRVVCWHISLCAIVGILANPNILNHYFPTAFTKHVIVFGSFAQGNIWGLLFMALFALPSQIVLLISCLVINLFHQLGVCEPFDSREHAPFFDSPLFPRSLGEFWGVQWHQIYRRAFIFLGFSPAAEMARFFGMSKRVQRVLGIFAAFMLSGVLHEYALWNICRRVEQSDHRVGFERLYMCLFFFLTAFLAVVEHFFPLLKQPGIVNVLWKVLYLFVVLLVSFTCSKLDFNHFSPVEEWDWQRFCIPLACFLPGNIWTK